MNYKKVGEKDEYIILTDENGEKIYYEFLDLCLYENEEYAVLLQKGDDMVTIFRFFEGKKGSEEYSTVENEDAFNAVFNRFREEFADVFDFD